MDLILLLFVIPFATIVFSIALESLLNNPFLVSLIIFSILLIFTFTVLTTDFLIYVIIYAILSFITALLFNIIQRYIKCMCCNRNSNDFHKCMCQRQNNRCPRS